LGIPHENNKIIYYCSQSKVDLERYWKIARDPDEEFVRLLREEGLDAAFDYFYSKTKNNPDSLLFTEEQINALGYEYLGEDDVDKAMALFKFNMELFPESFNVYDSYAESLMISGSNDSAIYYYKRSLELNPDNTNATDMIERISQH
jgi:tetratricopeptide (TPR) repeat protein